MARQWYSWGSDRGREAPGFPRAGPAPAATAVTHRAYLALGSNIKPEHNLVAGVVALGRLGKVVAASGVYETAPWGGRDQPNYLNAVVALDTELSAPVLVTDALPGVEVKLGRIRGADRYASRSIDIDMLLYDEAVMRIGEHRVPSPEIEERYFVAIPLAEIAPDLVHPGSGDTMAAIADRFRPSDREMRPRPDVVLIPPHLGAPRRPS